MNETLEQFQRLLTIMAELRQQCPWDRKQTIDTLRPMTIEELYELTDAITDKNWKGIKEELGDLMLHLTFYATIGQEQQQFTMKEVLETICDKLISRHPHIYGDVKVNDEEDVKRNWEKLKLKEGKTSALEGVPKTMPALVKAARIQEKAAKTGFDWPDAAPVWEKVKEEMAELEEAVAGEDPKKIEDELGDVFFSLVNYARLIGQDPEGALEQTNKKFIRRFQLMEKYANSNQQQLSSLSLAEMEALWQQAKKEE
jgi:XTP/dITP diphosphohydrolase